jgi:hypothetical protein
VLTWRHAQLIEELERLSDPTWGEAALLACLGKLRDGGPTEYELVEVRSARAADRGFDIVYLSPWGPEVGLTAREDQMQYFVGYFQQDDEVLTPEEFGYEIADLFRRGTARSIRPRSRIR